ncbi:unnamed protein product [Linum tenue]|uniref:F-box domain-containing protein n=1 Tax=Linum tenue TaxID=586396 RepID=A0AAV0MDJ5_9ROSI|nr:unnamed protein product [Linum tenue]
MVSENCNAEWDLSLSELFHRPAPRKRWRLSSEGNPPSAISKLGDDLLVEILISLPNPRSAFLCKPVCKLWSSLIFDPSFSRRFVARYQSMNLNQSPFQ